MKKLPRPIKSMLLAILLPLALCSGFMSHISHIELVSLLQNTQVTPVTNLPIEYAFYTWTSLLLMLVTLIVALYPESTDASSSTTAQIPADKETDKTRALRSVPATAQKTETEGKAPSQSDTPLNNKNNVVPIQREVKALVVDDDKVHQMVLCGLLERHGLKTVAASDGFEAVEQAQKQKFDIIFMDCVMPNMDGFTATQTIKNDLHNGLNLGTTVIAVSADKSSNIEAKVKHAGMVFYIPKPIDPDHLEYCLETYIGQRFVSSI